MGTNWQILGHFYGNDDVSNALNNAGIGVGAFVEAANNAGAVSAASTVNANNDWVLWGYVPA